MTKTFKVWLAVAALLFAGLIIAATRYISVPGASTDAGADARAAQVWNAWVQANTTAGPERRLMLADTVVATFADGLRKTYSLVCSTSECVLIGPTGVIADEGSGAGGGGGGGCSTTTTYTPNWATASGSTSNGDGTSSFFTVRWVESLQPHDTMQCT